MKFKHLSKTERTATDPALLNTVFEGFNMNGCPGWRPTIRHISQEMDLDIGTQVGDLFAHLRGDQVIVLQVTKTDHGPTEPPYPSSRRLFERDLNPGQPGYEMALECFKCLRIMIADLERK